MAARSCGASRRLLSVSIATRSVVVRSAVYGLTFALLAETVHGRGEPHLEVLAYYPPARGHGVPLHRDLKRVGLGTQRRRVGRASAAAAVGVAPRWLALAHGAQRMASSSLTSVEAEATRRRRSS